MRKRISETAIKKDKFHYADVFCVNSFEINEDVNDKETINCIKI